MIRWFRAKEKSMKKTRRITVLSLLILVALLAGCTGVPTGTNWPAVGASSDVAYISNTNSVYAVQLNNGSLLWKYPQETARTMFYAPAAVTADNQVIVGDYTKTLYSINPKNGNTNWQFTQASGRYEGSVLVTSDTIYAPNADYSVYALDLEGGLKWKFTTGQAVWAQPASDGEVVYVNSLDHFTYALKATDGSLIWRTDLQGPTVSSPVLGDGMLYNGMLDNGLVALQSDNGEIIWETPTDDAVFGTPVLKDGKLYLADLSGNIYCMDATSGKVDWRAVGGSVIAASPALIDNGVVFTSEDGVVTVYDFSGKVLWTRTITGQLNASPVVSGGVILVTSYQGDNLLTAFDFAGNQKWPPFNPPKK
jgi:outer membrane protein assembly factor BamB